MQAPLASRAATGAATGRASTRTAGQGHPLQRRDLLPLAALFTSLPVLAGPRMIAASAATTTAEQVLRDAKWPEEFPFRDELFARYDETPDTQFYDSPRFVTHIDDRAIEAITKYYDSQFPKDAAARESLAVLDMCSSWISHYPKGFSAGRVAGLGMNKAELERNAVLTEYDIVDLNEQPKLPYADNTFDFITNVVSVDYLTKPMEVFREMHRVLKPGGKAIMSFSNRCFPTKAIAVWTSTGDLDHVYIVGAYFHYSVPGGFTAPAAHDITLPKSRKGAGDPMYVVEACKAA